MGASDHGMRHDWATSTWSKDTAIWFWELQSWRSETNQEPGEATCAISKIYLGEFLDNFDRTNIFCQYHWKEQQKAQQMMIDMLALC